MEKIAGNMPGQMKAPAGNAPAGNAQKKKGRPTGSKTRPDAPSKLARAALNPTPPQPQPQAPPLNPQPGSNASRPDTDLFGSVPPPGNSEQEAETEFPPEDETPKNESQPEDHRPIATMIWDSAIGLLCAIMGLFWLPRKMGKNVEAGEIPYDEREMVIGAFCKYFASIGMTILSPAQELYMAIFAYCAPRLNLTFQWIKMRFMKKAKPAQDTPPPDNRMPGKETPAPEKEAAPPVPPSEKKEAPPFDSTQLDALR